MVTYLCFSMSSRRQRGRVPSRDRGNRCHREGAMCHEGVIRHGTRCHREGVICHQSGILCMGVMRHQDVLRREIEVCREDVLHRGIRT
jgi:hypothetical protein